MTVAAGESLVVNQVRPTRQSLGRLDDILKQEAAKVETVNIDLRLSSINGTSLLTQNKNQIPKNHFDRQSGEPQEAG